MRERWLRTKFCASSQRGMFELEILNCLDKRINLQSLILHLNIDIMSIADFLQKKKKERAQKNLMEGLAFLEQNKQRPEVEVTDSGLQYEVLFLSESDNKPTARSSVTCHYEGALINGTVFDSSKKRGVPATFPLNRVIPGWTEGLQLMPLGSTFNFYIPSQLAYGDRQVGSDIPPNSALVFVVELLAIN